MTGVISPTDLSLYSAPMAVSRSSTRTRWNEEEHNVIPHSVSSTNIENTQVILMEDCKFSITFGVTNVEFNLELISASGRYIDEYSSRDYVS